MMRIAFLCKRSYMGKDVILDRYARLYEIPFQLARRGHDVRCYCLSYRQGYEEGLWIHQASPGNLDWTSTSLRRRTISLRTLAYPWHLLRNLREFAPDVLIGASDIPHIVLTAWLAKRLGAPYVADLYDNFEGFGQARIPGMVGALRRATKNAALVTTTSAPLQQLVENDYAANGLVVAMPSTIDKKIFKPQDQGACRRSLGLPEQALLIGTAGGLHRDKGVDCLYTAWDRVAKQYPDAHLVLAGPHDISLVPPFGPRVHYLGMLPHAKTAELFGALDIGVIYLRDTPFGRYCFPQKAYEMLACDLPIVAANIGVMPYLLKNTPEQLYRADDPDDLTRAINHQLQHRRVTHAQIDDWEQLVAKMEQHILAIVRH